MLYWSLLTKIFSDITGRCWCGYHVTTIKRHAGWKSTTVAEGYVENSIENKTKIANQVLVGSDLYYSDKSGGNKVKKNRFGKTALYSYKPSLIQQEWGISGTVLLFCDTFLHSLDRIPIHQRWDILYTMAFKKLHRKKSGAVIIMNCILYIGAFLNDQPLF
ncbi:hypothetical protein NQ317_015916 [Molorchus minor]|uniref:Uncharacterized protein n=1 Tax=Molorchus minor TaxID=1323400 RepID=A0ABQ9JIR0_9CUCU|nr:hypothetical protein NQ317_015916 [Molorchus minor]